MARLLRALAAVSIAAHEIRLDLEQGPAYLTFQADDDLETVADAFAARHDLKGGEGCTGRECVVRMLTSAMRLEMGDGSIGVNRVSVSGVEYRRQGAREVRRQGLEHAPPPQTAAPAARLVQAPCAPPFCAFECATSDAAVEERLARDFIQDNPESRELMTTYPPRRTCPRGALYPIFIGIPRSEVVQCVPRKHYGFRGGHRSKFGDRAYAFDFRDEAEYKRAYREAYFGATKKKAGWDCMRHYEIVASGAVPFFDDDPTQAPEGTLAFWPRKLLRDLRTWPGVHSANSTVDADLLDASGYGALAAGLLTYLRDRLTTAALATYILETMGQADARKVLILSAHPAPDFLREFVVHGFREILGIDAVDFIKPQHLYEPSAEAPWDHAQRKDLYGNGFTYAYRLRDDPRVDRSDVAAKINAHFFDVVVYASVHRGLPYFDAVRGHYGPGEIAFVDGEDEHGWSNFSAALPEMGHYFMRELPDGCPPEVEVEGGFFASSGYLVL